MSKPYQVTDHFSVQVIHEIVAFFRFTRMARPEADAYDRFIRKAALTFKPPIRALYDLRESTTPVPYFTQKLEILFSAIALPEDTRNAYLIADNNSFRPWINILRRGSTGATTGVFQLFTEQTKAVEWLLEGIPQEPLSRPDNEPLD